MAKTMKIITIADLSAWILCVALNYFLPAEFLLTFTITLGTIFYHFAMRLIVGFSVNARMQNHTDPDRKWFQQKKFEQKLYSLLHVKKWKQRMPSYDPSLFSAKDRSPREIVQAMCQAEIVHEIIIVLSFLPLCFSIWFGTFWVFFLTSLLSACFDLMFVIMQRYNRPRLKKIIERKEQNHGI